MFNNGSGTAYALYAEVSDYLSYAGYFKGKVAVEGGLTANRINVGGLQLTNDSKITTTEGGYDNNMLAYLYGSISGGSSPSIVQYSSTQGLHLWVLYMYIW